MPPVAFLLVKKSSSIFWPGLSLPAFKSRKLFAVHGAFLDRRLRESVESLTPIDVDGRDDGARRDALLALIESLYKAKIEVTVVGVVFSLLIQVCGDSVGGLGLGEVMGDKSGRKAYGPSEIFCKVGSSKGGSCASWV